MEIAACGSSTEVARLQALVAGCERSYAAAAAEAGQLVRQEAALRLQLTALAAHALPPAAAPRPPLLLLPTATAAAATTARAHQQQQQQQQQRAARSRGVVGRGAVPASVAGVHLSRGNGVAGGGGDGGGGGGFRAPPGMLRSLLNRTQQVGRL